MQVLPLALGEAWWPTADDDASLIIDLRLVPPAVREGLSRRIREPLVLGYPVDLVKASTGNAFLRPVTTLAVDWTIEDQRLRLAFSTRHPQLNAAWLVWQRKAGRDVSAFLDWLGIDGRGPGGQKGGDEDMPAVIGQDMRTLTDAFATLVPRLLREPLTPAATARAFDPDAPAGLYNLAALFLTEPGRYAKTALRDLRRLATWSAADCARTALAPVLDGVSDGSSARAPVGDLLPVLDPLDLGEDQIAAVRDAMNQSLTVITGPPGTGKSQVVAALMVNAAVHGRTVLLASRNHKALDAVEERLTALSPEHALITRVSRPYGEGAPFRFDQAVDAVLARPAVPGGAVTLARNRTAAGALDREREVLIDKIARIDRLADAFSTAESERDALEARLGPKAIAWLSEHGPLPPWPVSNLIDRLAASVPWVGTMLARQRERTLVRHLQRQGVPWSDLDWPAPRADTVGRLRDLHGAAQEYANLLAREATLRADIEASDDRAELAERVVALSQQVRTHGSRLVGLLVNAWYDVGDEARATLTTARGALKLSTHAGGSDNGDVWDRYAALLLRHFPLWATTNLSVGGRLPLRAGMFDYVVIDEASQCDIASALSLLARARRAVIVGDPAQLRHVTSLSTAWEYETLKGLGLVDRVDGLGRFLHTANSLFDLAASAPGVRRHLLRDHYRCQESIAHYISEAFYGRQLRVLTSPAGLKPPPGQRPGLHWTNVTGPIVPATSGCHAPDEATAILGHLRHLLVEQGYTGTVGVVTPFREQAKRLTDAIADAIPAEAINRAALSAFTAHRFQGDARDVILVSFCIGPEMPAGSLAYVREGGNLVNVAVSRAKAVCHVFGNRAFAHGCGIPHVVGLVRAVDRGADGHTQHPFESPWEEKLFLALRAVGVDAIPQFPLAGRRLDLAIIRGGQKLDVEVDGDAFHRDVDGLRKSSDIWRDHQVRGVGWTVVRFWVYQLRENMDGCVGRILSLLDQ